MTTFDIWIPKFYFKVEIINLEGEDRECYTVTIPELEYTWKSINYRCTNRDVGDPPYTRIYNSFFENMLRIISWHSVQRGNIPNKKIPLWDNEKKTWSIINSKGDLIVLKKEDEQVG